MTHREERGSRGRQAAECCHQPWFLSTGGCSSPFALHPPRVCGLAIPTPATFTFLAGCGSEGLPSQSSSSGWSLSPHQVSPGPSLTPKGTLALYMYHSISFAWGHLWYLLAQGWPRSTCPQQLHRGLGASPPQNCLSGVSLPALVLPKGFYLF